MVRERKALSLGAKVDTYLGEYVMRIGSQSQKGSFRYPSHNCTDPSLGKKKKKKSI